MLAAWKRKWFTSYAIINYQHRANNTSSFATDITAAVASHEQKSNTIRKNKSSAQRGLSRNTTTWTTADITFMDWFDIKFLKTIVWCVSDTVIYAKCGGIWLCTDAICQLRKWTVQWHRPNKKEQKKMKDLWKRCVDTFEYCEKKT